MGLISRVSSRTYRKHTTSSLDQMDKIKLEDMFEYTTSSLNQINKKELADFAQKQQRKLLSKNQSIKKFKCQRDRKSGGKEIILHEIELTETRLKFINKQKLIDLVQVQQKQLESLRKNKNTDSCDKFDREFYDKI